MTQRPYDYFKKYVEIYDIFVNAHVKEDDYLIDLSYMELQQLEHRALLCLLKTHFGTNSYDVLIELKRKADLYDKIKGITDDK